jgi:hypothetical protein
MVGPVARQKGKPLRKRPSAALGFGASLSWNQKCVSVSFFDWKMLSLILTTIDGIDVMTVQTVFAELSFDMQAWASEEHFTSWLGLSPAPNISGGKVIGHQPRRVRNRVATALRMAAASRLRNQSYLGAKYRRLRTKLGAPKAIKAMARYLACLVYRMLTRGQAWVDHGIQQFERKNTEREKAALQRMAAAMGMQLVAVS